jgi:asparagine synthase (glutamine-hydrolysing)
MLYGWIDNHAELTRELALPADALPELIYDAAFQRWGSAVDGHLIGSYCAITALPGGRLRLVRSPWTAPPLHFVANPKRQLASSVLRVLFAAGHPREVDYDHVADQLLQDHHDGEPVGWYRGIGRVPLGSTVEIGQGVMRLERYYDPCAAPSVRFAKDEDYVAGARELLDRAAAAALAQSRKPGLMLSGGLDSPLVADALLRQMPADTRLPSFTFGPLPEWDGRIADHQFGEERDFVRKFAAMQPQLDPHFPSSQGHDFDYRLRDLLAACDAPTANVANVGIFHGAWEAARAAGCDTMLTADLGNFTYSNAAPWYPVEFLLRGRWGELARALSGHGIDRRPLWRKVASLAVLPLVSMLNPAARTEHRRRRQAKPLLEGVRGPRSRNEWIMRAWHSADSGEDLDLGFERLYGMRRRDVTAWRPLVEFCMGLPTDQFVRGTEHRRLALRLAEGRMPEAQRLNLRYGMHHPDWHLRLGRRRAELANYAERMRAHPFLGEAIDIDRIEALLADWPEQTPLDPAETLPRWIGITRALTTAAFIGYAEGRNDL